MDVKVEGHLFVVHGDLTRLSCDGILLPCDGDRAVSRGWFKMFQLEPPSEPWAPLPRGATLRASAKGPIEHRLVDTVSAKDDIEALVEAVLEDLGVLADDVGTRAGDGRVVPLLALPMPGTGNGGLSHRRGAVVHALVPKLAEAARKLGVDVALVARDRPDIAAIQIAREAPDDGLSDDLVDEAARLGRLAAADQLSLFVGAGTSVPLGLPTWSELVNRLLDAAGLDRISEGAHESVLTDAASRAREALGPSFNAELAQVVEVHHHALGHALLASLGAHQTVTTNFDRALELAMATTHGTDLKVLAREWATADAPWLLKLHGTAGDDRGVVLTAEDYERHRDSGRPLYGLVQGLLMTSHLLFVGFSLTDSNYLDLAKQVVDVYSPTDPPAQSVATALGLRSLSNAEHTLDEAFKHVTLAGEAGGSLHAARALEIFLDRMAWRATREREGAHAYLLDPRYADLVKGQGTEGLKEALLSLQHVTDAIKGPAAERVRWQLREFGADVE